jgi:hypothetical protein
MSNIDPAGTDWTDDEIDLIVADYFEMLQFERLDEPYVKAERNRALQDLTRRSKGSIEFKYQNISAVLLELGLDWIPGYKPMANYQKALIAGIERYLDIRAEALIPPLPVAVSGAAENNSLYLEPAPALVVTTVENEALMRLVRKFDAAARDERNRALGKRGEERVFFSERARLKAEGREDLARKIRWVSQEDGDGAGYDILSFEATGSERLLEVKTTVGGQKTPFFLSENERLLSTERPTEFRLFRLYEFNKQPKAFQLMPPLEHALILTPAIHRAAFEK